MLIDLYRDKLLAATSVRIEQVLVACQVDDVEVDEVEDMIEWQGHWTLILSPTLPSVVLRKAKRQALKGEGERDTKSMTEAEAEALGYAPARRLPTGELAGVRKQLFTYGLFVGITPHDYRTRFCFETHGEAVVALVAWDGEGWPPGYWVKQKPEDVSNPLREGMKR